MKWILVMALTILVLPVARAQARSTTSASPHRKVDYTLAKDAAQAKVPKGMLTSHELVHEHDRLLYSFEFTEAGKSGVKQVRIDASSGKVVKVKHESLKDEQEEKAKELRKSVSQG